MFPYLLRDIAIERANQAWALYIRIARGWVYRVAVLDWYSRRVLGRRVSITMEADFCVEAMREAALRYGPPEIVNTDQGSQFSSPEFVAEAAIIDARQSMDGTGRRHSNSGCFRHRRQCRRLSVRCRTGPRCIRSCAAPT